MPVGSEFLLVQVGKRGCYQNAVLTPIQLRYCTTRKELLTLVAATRHFRHYLLGRRFSLACVMRFRHLKGQLVRWCEELSQYDLVILHRGGKKHGNADGLSSIPDRLEACNCYIAGQQLDSLPCGGCLF